MAEQVRYNPYPIRLDELREGIKKLRELSKYMRGQPPSVYDFSKSLADSLEEKLMKLLMGSIGLLIDSAFEVFDFNMAVFFAKGTKPSNDAVVAIAKAAFGESYAGALRKYYVWLDKYVNNP